MRIERKSNRKWRGREGGRAVSSMDEDTSITKCIRYIGSAESGGVSAEAEPSVVPKLASAEEPGGEPLEHSLRSD